MAILPGNRIRKNGVFGTTTDNPLTLGAVTYNSAELATLPVVSGNHAIVTLDPLKQFGDPEIVMVTAHTAAATVATITRGMFGTVARAHPQGTLWVHAATQDDFVEDLTSGTRPSDQYRGQRIYESDTNRYIGYSSANTWQQEGLFFDPPACQAFHNTTQTALTGTVTTLLFNSERFDTDSMHSTVSLTDRITFNTAGIYVLTLKLFWDNNAVGIRFIGIFLSGATAITSQRIVAANESEQTISEIYKFAVGDFINAQVFQTSGGTRTVGSPELSACWIGRGN